MRFTTSALLSLAAGQAAYAYTLVDNFVGPSFLTGFDHQAIADPTNGRVNYVDQATAVAKNLTYAKGNTLILRADSTTTLSASGPGRNSVRIRSKKTYTTHVAVFDVRHMPQGCGTWPAIWEVREDGWPNYGEVDIVEGVNDISPNAATLHTSAGCTMPASVAQTGSWKQLDCNTAVNGNAGCGVALPTTNSYGPAFNSAGGGYYVMERTPSFIKVWFFSRQSSVPAAVSSGAQTIDTSSLGTPAAYFPNTSCDLNAKLGAHNIIINLTLCGDWAGSVYNQDGCSGSCVDNVNNNPKAFANAYFDIAAVRVYQ